MSASKELEGKPDLSLIPYCVEAELARAMMSGESRYGRYNYCKGHKASQLVAAAKRHLGQFLAGEDTAPDTGVLHLAHAMANCLMLIHQCELGTLLDDRYPAPPAATTPPVAKIWEVRAVPSLARETTVLGCYQTRADAECAALNYHVKHWPAPSFKLVIEEVDDVQSA